MQPKSIGRDLFDALVVQPLSFAAMAIMFVGIVLLVSECGGAEPLPDGCEYHSLGRPGTETLVCE